MELNKKMLDKYLETQIMIMNPIIPHLCEYIWKNVMNRQGFIQNRKWPKVETADASIRDQRHLLEETIKEIRSSISKWRSKHKTENINSVCMEISTVTEPEWKVKALSLINQQILNLDKLKPQDFYDKHLLKELENQKNLKKIYTLFVNSEYSKVFIDKGDDQLKTGEKMWKGEKFIIRSSKI